jgi:hypothetical protein
MKKLMTIGLAVAVAAALGGCFGYVQEGGEIDMGGYIGRLENNPPQMDGWLGETSSQANWSKKRLLNRADLHAWGDDEYVQKKRAEAGTE